MGDVKKRNVHESDNIEMKPKVEWNKKEVKNTSCLS